jgi:hypothetical protein
MHALAFAEATGKKEVKLRSRDGHFGSLPELFDLPDTITIERNPEFERRANCPKPLGLTAQMWSFGYIAGCTNIERRDYHRVLVKYLKPHLNVATREACAAARAEAYDGLTLHLRSGDLMVEPPPGEEMPLGWQFMEAWLGVIPPCAIHERVIREHGFEHVKLVTEADMKHPCVKELKARLQPQVNLTVQTGTLQQDACALMEGKSLGMDDSSFMMGMELLNERAENIYTTDMVASMTIRQGVGLGSASDPFGQLTMCRSGEERRSERPRMRSTEPRAQESAAAFDVDAALGKIGLGALPLLGFGDSQRGKGNDWASEISKHPLTPADHKYIADSLRGPQVSPSTAETRPSRRQVKDPIEIEAEPPRRQKRTYFLYTSDGLWDMRWKLPERMRYAIETPKTAVKLLRTCREEEFLGF